MKTIIFGGSFDPIHNAHIAIVEEAQRFLKAEKVVFLPSKNPRWKNPNTNEKQRLEMLKMALKGKPEYYISEIEINSLDPVDYTYNSLTKYKKEYPDEELYFLIGTDQENQLPNWYRINDLLLICKIIVINRPDYQFKYVDRYQLILLNNEVSDMSSTSLRTLKKVDAPLEVLEYIGKNNLYYMKEINKYLKEMRKNHSLSVASLAYKIAKANNLDYSKAYIAGLLHDIGKEIPIDEQVKYLNSIDPELKNKMNPPLYHQFMSVKIAKEVFDIKDEEILNAIKCHATGKSKMNWLDKIIYSSDKIDPSRDYDSSSMINACLEDYEKGFKYVLEENIKFLKEKGINYNNEMTSECINFYLKED